MQTSKDLDAFLVSLLGGPKSVKGKNGLFYGSWHNLGNNFFSTNGWGQNFSKILGNSFQKMHFLGVLSKIFGSFAGNLQEKIPRKSLNFYESVGQSPKFPTHF